MAQPWHADFIACRTEGQLDARIAWWPVQRPDDVFIRNAAGPPTRAPWARGLNDAEDMVARWFTLGFVIGTGNDLFETDGPSDAIA